MFHIFESLLQSILSENHQKYYPGEPVKIYIRSLVNIIQDNNWVITTKKGKGKLILFWW